MVELGSDSQVVVNSLNGKENCELDKKKICEL